MIKSKLAGAAMTAAGAVWLVDNFVTNMPHVLEGGLFIATLATSLLGAKRVARMLHQATIEQQPAERGEEQARAAHPAGSQLDAGTSPLQLAPAAREDLLRAYQMGAQAASQVRRIER